MDKFSVFPVSQKYMQKDLQMVIVEVDPFFKSFKNIVPKVMDGWQLIISIIICCSE